MTLYKKVRAEIKDGKYPNMTVKQVCYLCRLANKKLTVMEADDILKEYKINGK